MDRVPRNDRSTVVSGNREPKARILKTFNGVVPIRVHTPPGNEAFGKLARGTRRRSFG